METILLFIANVWNLLILMIIALGILSFFLQGDERKKEYDDDFGNSSEVMSMFKNGFDLGSGKISRDKSFLHCACIGASGLGKTSGILLTTALSINNASVIFLDPAKELHLKSSGELFKKGYTIKVLDFSDFTRSIGFNPLARAKSSTEVNLLAEMIFAPQMRNSKDVFWPQMGMKVLVVIFKLQKLLPTQFQNLPNTKLIVDILLARPKDADKIFSKYADDKLWTEYLAIAKMDQKLLSNILVTCQSSLRSFDDDNIARVCSNDTLDIAGMRKTKTALFIQFNVMDASYYSFLVEILFTQMFREIMNNLPSKDTLDLFFICDEMGSISIKGFAEATSNLRKYNVGILYAIQSKSQLIQRYGRENAETILANSWSKIYFPGMEQVVAKELENRLGKWTFERDDQKGKSTREVMTASELIHLEQGYAMLVAGANRPMKIKIRPYYERIFMSMKAEITPPVVQGDVDDSVAYMDCEKLLNNKMGGNV